MSYHYFLFSFNLTQLFNAVCRQKELLEFHIFVSQDFENFFPKKSCRNL